MKDDRGAEQGPGQSPGFLLWKVTNRWQRSIVAALKPVDLTHVQFVLLASVWWLSRDGKPLPTQRDVADHAGTDPMMTSQVVRVLEPRDLITRGRDPRDGRAWRLSTTARGAQLAERAIEIVETADRAFFVNAEPTQLVCTLRSLAAARPPDRHPQPTTLSAASR